MDISLRAVDNWADIDFGFDPNILNYDISIPTGYRQLKIVATTSSGSVKISEVNEEGIMSLPPEGSITVFITVIPQDKISAVTTYQLNFIKSKSQYITNIRITGLGEIVNFVPLKSEYTFKYIIGTAFQLPTINVSAGNLGSAGAPIIYINGKEISTLLLNEGTNEIVIVDNSGITDKETRYSIIIEVIIDSDYIDNLSLNSTRYIISHIDKVYKYCSVEIDLTNPNPATCCKYTDDSVIFEKCSSKWDTFFGHYPVVFKEGKERVRVDPNNFKKDIFGNSISTNDGDIMIKFPRRGISINYKNTNTLVVSMTDNPNDFRYTYYAHNVGNVERDAFYLGAYKLSLPNDDGKYINTAKGRSVSNKYIEKGLGATGGNRIIPNEIFRYYCENNNSFVNCENYESPDPGESAPSYSKGDIVRYKGNYWKVINEDGTYNPPSDRDKDWELLNFYTIEGFFQRTFLQVMYILKYANLNSQTTIGAGFVKTGTNNFNRTTNENKTGYTDTYGMDSELVRDSILNYKNPNASQPSQGQNVNDYHVKLFGIEDLWGNAWEYIRGIDIDKAIDRAINVSFNCGLDKYSVGEVETYTNAVRYLKKPMGTSHEGFIESIAESGLSNQYFCDLGRIDNPSPISTSSGIVRMYAQSNCGANDGNYPGIFAIALQMQVSNYYKSNFNWFGSTPRFEAGIFTYDRDSTYTLSKKPEDFWGNKNCYFTCNASSAITARLMYI